MKNPAYRGVVMNPRDLMIAFLFCTMSLFSAACSAESDPSAAAVEAPAASDTAVREELTGDWTSGWYSGVDGYARALAEYEKTNRPMAVYVNVTWCPYCRSFEKNVLSAPLVRRFMRDVIKVNLDPEKGERENAIAFQYGVMGFPSFYVHPPQPSGTRRIPTGVSPEQFIEYFKKTLQ